MGDVGTLVNSCWLQYKLIAYNNVVRATKNETLAIIEQVEHAWVDLLTVLVPNFVMPCRTLNCWP